jgi:two-component system LytT family response regulator
MKVLIIEDEVPAAEKLVKLIKKYDPNIEILAQFDDVETTVNWFKKNEEPDLMFLDIHLADGLSFEIFNQTDVKCPIIFTTAYDQYAIHAFKVNSVDYLLKPIKYDDFESALKKYKSVYATKEPDVPNFQKIADLIKNQQRAYKSRFLAKAGNFIKTIAIEDVSYFISEDKVTFIVSKKNKMYPINYTLDDLEELLDPGQFNRANRKFLIGIDSIAEIHPYFKGRLKIVLAPKQEEELVVSSGKSSSFKNWLGK